MALPEITVSPNTPMPKGYGFLKKGWPYKTALCRRETHAANKTLYVVKDKSQVLGLRAPKWILFEIGKKERATRDDRKESVAKRDSRDQEQFQRKVKEMYHLLPEQEVAQLAGWTLRKRKGRVGRTGTLPLETKVHLAVAAHARHMHTEYDKLIKEKGREKARNAVAGRVNELLTQWKGPSSSDEDPALIDPTLVYSLSEDSDDEDDSCKDEGVDDDDEDYVPMTRNITLGETPSPATEMLRMLPVHKLKGKARVLHEVHWIGEYNEALRLF